MSRRMECARATRRVRLSMRALTRFNEGTVSMEYANDFLSVALDDTGVDIEMAVPQDVDVAMEGLNTLLSTLKGIFSNKPAEKDFDKKARDKYDHDLYMASMKLAAELKKRIQAGQKPKLHEGVVSLRSSIAGLFHECDTQADLEAAIERDLKTIQSFLREADAAKAPWAKWAKKYGPLIEKQAYKAEETEDYTEVLDTIEKCRKEMPAKHIADGVRGKYELTGGRLIGWYKNGFEVAPIGSGNRATMLEPPVDYTKAFALLDRMEDLIIRLDDESISNNSSYFYATDIRDDKISNKIPEELYDEVVPANDSFYRYQLVEYIEKLVGMYWEYLYSGMGD